MKRTSQRFATLCIAALGIVAALPAAPATAAIEVINLRVQVENRHEGRGPQYYGIKPAESVPLAVGETARASLVGTAAGGAQVPVDASFFQVTNRSSIALGRSGANWVEVKGVSNYGNGLAALGYKVTDRRYAMRGGFTEGRITFQMGGNAPTSTPVTGNDSRLQAARDVAGTLYRSLLGDDLRSQRAQDDVRLIYRNGYSGIQQVAAELAREADARRVFAGQPTRHVAGELYRGLLGRTGTDEDLMIQDPGFRGAVESLRRYGLSTQVQTIVGSDEFRSVHNLQASGLS
ncbi:MAG TPA: hypothetical protein VIH93_01465 [Thermoanaerobaculia bacterium]